MRDLCFAFALVLAGCAGSQAPSQEGDGSAKAAPSTAATPSGQREDIDVATLAQRLAAGGVTLIDVRTPEEFSASHVPSAQNVPIDTLATALGAFDKTKPLTVICQRGGRSSTATDQLLAAGFAKVTNVEGGTSAWIAAGQGVAGGPAPGDVPGAANPAPIDSPPPAAPPAPAAAVGG